MAADKRINMMRLVVLILFFTSMVSCDSIFFNMYDNQETQWLKELTDAKYCGRKTGTEECKAVYEYLTDELESMGYRPRCQEFVYKDSIVMRNIIVEVPGQCDSIVIIGAHYDGAVYSPNYDAANDNASGVVALLSIAQNLPRQNKYDVMLCFWDGEESTAGRSLNGSRHFVSSFEELSLIRWYCNIDCCGRVGDDIYLYYRDQNMGRECSRIWESSMCKNSCLSIIDKVQENHSSDYESFRNKNVPFWGWNDYDVFRYIHTMDDSYYKVSVEKIKDVASLTIYSLSVM